MAALGTRRRVHGGEDCVLGGPSRGGGAPKPRRGSPIPPPPPTPLEQHSPRPQRAAAILFIGGCHGDPGPLRLAQPWSRGGRGSPGGLHIPACTALPPSLEGTRGDPGAGGGGTGPRLGPGSRDLPGSLRDRPSSRLLSWCSPAPSVGYPEGTSASAAGDLACRPVAGPSRPPLPAAPRRRGGINRGKPPPFVA